MFHSFPEIKKKGNKEDKNYDVMIEMEEKRLSTPMLDKSSSELLRKTNSKEVFKQETSSKYIKQTKKEINQQISDQLIETNHSVFYPEPDNKEKDDHHSKLTIDQ